MWSAVWTSATEIVTSIARADGQDHAACERDPGQQVSLEDTAQVGTEEHEECAADQGAEGDCEHVEIYVASIRAPGNKKVYPQIT